MKNKTAMFFALVAIGFIACSKTDNNTVTTTSNTLNLSAQDSTDFAGNIYKSVKDSQWQNRYLTDQEMALFQSLDTADLSGTIKPGSVSQSFYFPNPFTVTAFLYFNFNSGYVGQTKFKYVIVNNLMAPQQKGVATLSNTKNNVQLNSNLPIGQYRIYYTLSAVGNEHYYRSWGNIERLQ